MRFSWETLICHGLIWLPLLLVFLMMMGYNSPQEVYLDFAR